MRFADSLRHRVEPPPAVKADRSRVSSFGLSPWRQGKAYDAGQFGDVERNVREGYEKVTWVFRCVNAIAKRFARLPKVYRRGDPDTGEIVRDHPLLPLFNVSPSSLPQHRGSPDSVARYFWQRVAAQYLLSKRGAFVEVIRRNGDNAPIALNLLPPGITYPVPGSGGTFLAGFEVRVPGRERPLILPPDDVLWVRDPHPLDPYMAQTPLEPLGLAIDSDWWAKLYNRAFLLNYGRPGMAIFVRGEIDDDDADELKSRMTPGPGGAGRSAVIETVAESSDGTVVPGAGIDIVDFSKTPVDISWLEGRKANKDEILEGFALPESVAVGNASGRTFANADAEYVTFWLDTMPDYTAGMLQPFDTLDGDPALFLGADFSGQREYQEVAAMRTKQGLEKLDKGGISPDEYRDVYENLPPMPGGNVLYLPANRLPLGGRPAAPADDERTATIGTHKVDASALDAVKRIGDRRWQVWESSVTGHLRGFFERQERVVVERLGSARVLRGTRHWEDKGGKRDHAGAGSKAIDPAAVYDRDAWDVLLVDLMDPLWRAILSDYGSVVLAQLAPDDEPDERSEDDVDAKADVEFDLTDPRVIEFLQERGRKIVGINETTRQAIVQAIAAGETAGDGIRQIAARIRQVFAEASSLRARTIARTELLSASNEGSLDGARQSGVPDLRKMWLATSDDRTRDTHRDIDGAEVELEEAFDVGGAAMLYPGDPAGPASETINCRCTLLYVTERGVIL